MAAGPGRRPAASADPAMPVLPADAAAMPFADQSSDLVRACVSLPDIDDLDGAVSEIGRVLRPGGRLCPAVLHPFVSARNEDTMRTASFRFSRPSRSRADGPARSSGTG